MYFCYRRFLNLEKEITKVLSNSHLSKDEKREIIKEKHSVYVKPVSMVFYYFQRLFKIEAIEYLRIYYMFKFNEISMHL